VKKGQCLTEGYIDPQQLLEVEGLEAVQKYLVDGIQEVYFSQGVSINNKHIEVILRKVAPVNRVRITEEGTAPSLRTNWHGLMTSTRSWTGSEGKRKVSRRGPGFPAGQNIAGHRGRAGSIMSSP
jgi:hypothetical protein